MFGCHEDFLWGVKHREGLKTLFAPGDEAHIYHFRKVNFRKMVSSLPPWQKKPYVNTLRNRPAANTRFVPGGALASNPALWNQDTTLEDSIAATELDYAQFSSAEKLDSLLTTFALKTYRTRPMLEPGKSPMARARTALPSSSLWLALIK